ncbi:MAG: pilus assembly protein [Tepidimonas sp.]|uniref:pilus assembly protein n=1 Tax=Tepidimonas sp. TaxID=2002775 RepID=UPI004054B2EB
MTHTRPTWMTVAGLLAATLGMPVDAVAQNTPWPQIPLFIGLTVPPTLVLALDDSTSMDFEVLLPTNDGALWWNTTDKSFIGRDGDDSPQPGAINYNKQGDANSQWIKYVYLFPNGAGQGNRVVLDHESHFAVPPLPQFAFLRSAAYNALYYDPTVTYLPWPSTYGYTFSDINPTAAPSDPVRGGGLINLTQPLYSSSADWLFRVQKGMAYVEGTMVKSYSSAASLAFTYYPATYYVPTQPAPTQAYNNGNSKCTSPKPSDYVAFEKNPLLKLPPGVDAIGPDGRCLTRFEIKNGQTFPSGRTYAEELQNFANWFSYYRKRHLATRGSLLKAFESVRGITLATFGFNRRVSPLRFYDYPGVFQSETPVGKLQLFNDINSYVGTGGTPTRESLQHLGAELARTTDSPLKHACQRNYGLIFTDGFATNATLSVGNIDSRYGAPYADNYPNTLADLAMKFYLSLRPGGAVPPALGCGIAGAPPWLDCNTEWHLNTYAITLGARGTIYGVTHASALDAYTSPPQWPQPNIPRSPRMVDDLYHATVNGRGETFVAKNAEEIELKLRQIINTVVNLSASGGGTAVNTRRLEVDARVFYASFESGTWSGNIVAYPIQAMGIGRTPLWDASSLLPAANSRNIFTRSATTGVPFVWNQLGSANQSAVGNEDIVRYIRGDRSKEQQFGGVFRNRPPNNILGDIAHSALIYIKESDTIFVGANDGMLHAFEGSTGRERFAYIPSLLLGRLKNLTNIGYQHEYFVDGEIAVSSKLDTDGRNILVAALGRGGKGLFALDVTQPDHFSASHVLWENFGAGDSDLGYILGKPVIAKMNNNEWVVITGNGYSSASGKAALYIYRLSDGSLLKKFNTQVGMNNGAGTPTVWDEDGDRKIDFIYFGDIRGNVWRIDVSRPNPSQWDFIDKQGNQPVAFFTARDASNKVQPITAPIAIVENNVMGTSGYGKRFLLFGTGSYFRIEDANDRSLQSWYGLIDGAPITGRSQLVPRAIANAGFFDGKAVRTFGDLTAGDMEGKKGWFLDFTGGAGERIISQVQINSYKSVPYAVASSIIPSIDPCQAQGRGYLNFINPFTGTRLRAGVADINDNNDFSDDKLADGYIGSVDIGVGMPGAPILTSGRVVVPGSSGLGSIRLRLAAMGLGRIHWREIIRD